MKGNLLNILLDNFVNKLPFKSVGTFFKEWSIDVKSAVIFDKCPLMEELKLKICKSTIFLTFSILALSPECEV